MEQINPYAASPVSQAAPLNVDPAHGVVITPAALAAIIRTKVWVQIVGIVFYVSAGITVLSLFVGSDVADVDHLIGPMDMMGVFTMLLVLLVVVAYVVLGLRLMQYGKGIKRLAVSNHPADFEKAVEAQTKFWILAGIFICVLLVLSIAVGIGVYYLTVSSF